MIVGDDGPDGDNEKGVTKISDFGFTIGKPVVLVIYYDIYMNVAQASRATLAPRHKKMSRAYESNGHFSMVHLTRE